MDDPQTPTTVAPEYTVASTEDQQLPLYQLLMRLLGRQPTPRELTLWRDRISGKPGIERFVEHVMAWKPVATTKVVRTKNPAGHFFSPVVDPDEVRDYVMRNRAAGPNDLAGIDFHLDEMLAFWTGQADVIARTPFPETPDPAHRYFYTGGPYGYGDATTLRAMIHAHRPKRIVEIGSGYSTACMLDSIDEFGLDTTITCIEPYPARLLSVLRPEDRSRLTLVESGVQGQPAALFSSLAAGDILFIDSTHVMKTGSDVHFEIFSILPMLPMLPPGVIIHVHDCRFPLEYSDTQIFQKNYSWNEAYAIRALLMYSTRFRVLFSGSLFAREQRALVQDTFPTFLRNPGSALWLQVMDDGTPGRGDPHFDAPGVAATDASTPRADPRPLPAGVQDTSVVVGAQRLSFAVRTDGTGPLFFSMGIRKSGSTLLHKMTTALAHHNDVVPIDVPGTFFKRGLGARDWARMDWSPFLRPQNMLTGFRSFPRSLQDTAAYGAARKVFMFRNPLDALVSQYFSDAYLHSLPASSLDPSARERFLQKREEAQRSEINAWVIDKAGSMAATMQDFVPVLNDPNCLVLRYEDAVFAKPEVIDRILDHFGWTLTTDAKAGLLASVDVVPTDEVQTRFVRKVVPGDQLDKLSPETIDRLRDMLGPVLRAFDYA